MAYQKQTWEDLPSTNTPITASRLNHMEDGIYEAYERIGGGETLPMETNIDNISTFGFYGVFNATGTLPTGYSTSDNNIFIQNMLWGNGDYGRQVLYDIRSNNTYTRQKNNGTWQSWVSLI